MEVNDVDSNIIVIPVKGRMSRAADNRNGKL